MIRAQAYERFDGLSNGGNGQPTPPGRVRNERDLILESYAALAPEALDALSPEERRKVYVILDLTVEAVADGGLKISGAFGEEPVWEDVRTSTR
ncbi:MAG: hypothetical protein LC714_03685 [Actinobacteria bacterium]|nr:hypothetical protein [Actinomycetota bacterium]